MSALLSILYWAAVIKTRLSITYKLLLRVKVTPYLYLPESPSISVTEGNDANITCYLLVGTENNQHINWTWTFRNDLLADNDKYMVDESTSAFNSTLTVRSAVQGDRGDYYCISENSFGTYSRMITLRVKSTSQTFY